MGDSAAAFSAFFESGSVTGDRKAAAPFDDRLAFVRANWKDPEFRKRAWPYCAAFVDASNVARWDRPAVHEVTRDKAQVKWLIGVEDALRKLAYIPVMVSDANLIHMVDEPWTFKDRWGKYPHTQTPGQKADNVVLRALRSLPEAVCISRDRFRSPDEQKAYPDVLADRSRFYAFRFDDEGRAHFFSGEDALPHAARRIAAAVGQS